MTTQKIIAFFPEAAFGPALNSVGIAQACEALGNKAVFLTDPGMRGVYQGYGFDEHIVNLSEPMDAEAMAKYWQAFINGHIKNFDKPPYEQIDNYIRECWEAIVSTSKWAEKDLPAVLEKVKPDLICVDNVILFPAIKRYSRQTDRPWVRVISCSENEIEDPDIPPHLSGCGEHDKAAMNRYRQRFAEIIKPIHDDFNNFLSDCGEQPYPLGQFCETSPFMNLLLYPEAVRFKRRKPLDGSRFHYLQGCVRRDQDYVVPTFKAHNDKPLVYVSFGSLGSGDTATLRRLIDDLGRQAVRALVNVGDYLDAYASTPDNVQLGAWFPQPSVISQADAVIHHGGNNSFTECLFYGKPAIIMPYVWDGHDNATRVEETGHGIKMHRNNWRGDDLADNVQRLLTDVAMHAKLRATSADMQSRHGPTQAAQRLQNFLAGSSAQTDG